MDHVREVIQSQFFGFMGNNAVSKFRDFCWRVAETFLNIFRFPGGQRILRVANGADTLAVSSLTLAASGTRIRAQIVHWGEETEESQCGRFPELKAHKLRDALVMENWSYQSAIVGRSLVIPSRESEGSWKLGGYGSSGYPTGIKACRNGLAWASVRLEDSPIEKAAYVGTRSPRTWAHWLINFLPSVYLLSTQGPKLEGIPLLIPSHLPQDSHWHESLRVVLGNRDTIPLKPKDFTLVRHLLWIEPPFYDTPFASSYSIPETTSLHLEVMSGFREIFIEALARKQPMGQLPRRFFLARGAGSRRPYNQSEAIALAKRFGIEPIYVETLTFWQKLQLFHQAEVIVGPEGSGLANIVFATSRALALTWWAGRPSSTDNYLYNLASLSGARYSRAPASWTTGINSNDGSYKVDLASLELAFSKL